MNRLGKVLFYGCWIFLLTACASSTPVPEDRFYRLPEPESVAAIPTKYETLAIRPIRAHGLYNERAMLYVIHDQPLEVLRYHYHYWLDAPSYLIQHNMLSWLRKSNIAREVMRYGPGVDDRHMISGQLLHFERVLDKDAVRVSVALELTLYSERNAVFTKTYPVIEKATGTSINETVKAMGRALEKIYQSFLSDIRSQG